MTTGADDAMFRWLAERLISAKVVLPCNCGHDLSEHSWNETDPNEELGDRPWPCTFPVSFGAPRRLCHCADFTEPD